MRFDDFPLQKLEADTAVESISAATEDITKVEAEKEKVQEEATAAKNQADGALQEVRRNGIRIIEQFRGDFRI